MLSKEQKLRYGQMLRQQMKQKEEKKKIQQLQKRGAVRQLNQPKQPQNTYKPTVYQKQNSYQRQYTDPKQQLQKKLQSQQYNYFGGLGGGAPNKVIPGQNNKIQQINNRNYSHPTNIKPPVEQLIQYNGMNNPYNNQYQNSRNNYPYQNPNQLNMYQKQFKTIDRQIGNYNQNANYNQNGNFNQNLYQRNLQQESFSPQTLSDPRNAPIYNQPIRQQNPYNNNFNGNPSFQNVKQINSRIQQIDRGYPLQPSNSMQGLNLQQQYQSNLNSYPQANNLNPYNNQMMGPNSYNVDIGTISPNPIRQQLRNYNQQNVQQGFQRQNEQLQQLYRKGGRNLLKLQNQTIDQHLIKQKRKMQIQKQLKQQIEQAQRKKKQQKQRIKRQEEQEQRKHKQYLAQQKRRLDQQQRKKKQTQQRAIQQNQRNLQKKKQLQEEAKRKAEMEQKAKFQKQKRQRQAQKMRQQQQIQKRNKRNVPPQQREQNHYQDPRINNINIDEDTSSVVSSDTSSLEKGFNTALSRQFFKKQRQRNNPSLAHHNQKLEKVTNQIQKISNQIQQQRDQYDRQIQKIKDEAQRAKIDKKKAQQQIQRLKVQLKRKMDQDNQKLLRALQGNDYRNNDFTNIPQPFNHNQTQNHPNRGLNLNSYETSGQIEQYPSFNKKPLKQKESQQLIQKVYEPKQNNYYDAKNQFQQSNVGLVSLDGDSKKIPLYLQHGDKLTLSQVQNFAKDSSFFQKGVNNKHSPPLPKYKSINQSIAEVDEDRDYGGSRKSTRKDSRKKQSNLYKKEKDELDKLMQSRAKSRGGWGQMSSVNSDITKQIQQLLKKKQGNNGRPSSISNAGKQSLGRQGYSYDGLTLNSHVGVGTLNTNGTLDLQRINGRNQARLRELKNLGVQTINTNGDDDLNALDQLLNKYK